MPEKAKVFLVVKGGGMFSHQFFIPFFDYVSQSCNHPFVKGKMEIWKDSFDVGIVSSSGIP